MRKFISALLVFLLLTSVAVPAATAAETPEVYYELHDMCLCGAHADLGRIPFATFGIGYEGRVVDDVKDKWILFIHAGAATKKIIITPETPMSKLVTLRDFVGNVDKCKVESDQIPTNVLNGLASGTIASVAFTAGGLSDNAYVASTGVLPAGVTINEFRQAVDHWNSAKNAQKNAEKLFKVL